jgi:ABC-type glycerol-3-phosphate transport system permease component
VTRAGGGTPWTRGPRLLRAGFALWVLGAVVSVLFPVYLLVMVSVAPGHAIFGERPALLVLEPTLRFWQRVIERGDLWGPLGKSLVVATATTLAAWSSPRPAPTSWPGSPPAPATCWWSGSW